jgi:hypothetical protein
MFRPIQVAGLRWLALTVLLAECTVADHAADEAPDDRLVVLIAVDQLRADYLTRWPAHFNRGFARLLEHGAFFANACVSYGAIETPPGHATIGTSCLPRQHGIVGNKWFLEAGVTTPQQPVEPTRRRNRSHWVSTCPWIYCDPRLVELDNERAGKLTQAATKLLRQTSRIADVFTAADLSSPAPASDDHERWLAWRSYHPQRSGRFYVRLAPGWTAKDPASIATHAGGSRSDRHVPILLAGAGVRAGQYCSAADLLDLAPTLSAGLGIEPPPEAVGRVWGEALRADAASGPPRLPLRPDTPGGDL